MKKEFEVIEVPSSGKKGWYEGAWCLVFVYSSKGNFLLKGFRKECVEYIKSKNWKCWAVFNLYPNYLGRRTIISTFNCDFEISQPFLISKKRKSEDYKFRIYSKGNWENGIYIKRLPKKFVNFKVEKLNVSTNSIGSNNEKLLSLKDKMDQNK